MNLNHPVPESESLIENHIVVNRMKQLMYIWKNNTFKAQKHQEI